MTGRAEKEKKRKERTESRKSQRGVGKSQSQSEKELEAYKKHYKETMKNWNHNTMKMYPPTPAEWQKNKQYYKRISPNAKGGIVKKSTGGMITTSGWGKARKT